MKTFLFALLGVLFSLLSSHASATTIRYEAIDLLDITGDDLWQYQYEVSDYIFNADDGFSIVFARGLYDDLEDPLPPPNNHWHVLSLQPDLSLPDPGLYDALALTNDASLNDRFIINFIWLGSTGQPGSQPFEIYTLDAGNVNTIETGSTIPLQASVPEPGMWALLGVGLLGLAVTRRRRGARPG